MTSIRASVSAVATLAATLAVGACDFTDPVPPPAAPPALTADAVTDTAAELAWTVPTGEVDSYRVERDAGTGVFTPLATVGDSVTTLVDGGLVPSTTYRYQVVACNESGCSAPSPVASATTLATLAVVTDDLPPAVEGTAYTVALEANGGRRPYTWEVVEGTLPPGLALSPDGTLSGVPTTPDVYNVRVRATSRDGQTAEAPLALAVRARLEITTVELPGAVLGEPYTAGLSARGGVTPYAWSVIEGALPEGIALAENGVLSGVPDREQTAGFTVRVRGAEGQTDTRSFTIRVASPGAGDAVTIETALLPPGLRGEPYEPVLRADGGDGTFTWSVVGGALPPGVTLAPDGSLSGRPTATGRFTLTVRAASGGSADTRSYTFDVVADDPLRYDLTRMDVVQVPANIEPHVRSALERWARIIRGDLEGGQIPRGFFGSRGCGGFGEALNGTSVDDVVIMINIAPIDGPGKVLGRAGPCAIDDVAGLSAVGILTLDSEDLAPLVGSETLTGILVHEIGHILGFGTLWASLSGEPAPGDPRFTGDEATREWQALGGVGFVPVEASGGEGTAGSHWRESVFDWEVMTGFSEPRGVPMPFSRVSVGAMADLGYTVDFTAADPYTLPSTSSAPALVAGPAVWDEAGVGPVKVLGRKGAKGSP